MLEDLSQRATRSEVRNGRMRMAQKHRVAADPRSNGRASTARLPDAGDYCMGPLPAHAAADRQSMLDSISQLVVNGIVRFARVHRHTPHLNRCPPPESVVIRLKQVATRAMNSSTAIAAIRDADLLRGRAVSPPAIEIRPSEN